MKDKQLSVSAIKDGTVIDHVPASVLFKVVSILNLARLDIYGPEQFTGLTERLGRGRLNVAPETYPPLSREDRRQVRLEPAII